MIQNPASEQPFDLPTYIVIDGIEYRIVRAKLEAEDGEFCAGTLRIRINENLPRPYERTILLHEITHACFEHAGSPGGSMLSEETVACLVSRRLLPILRDNPHVLAYLTATDDGR